MYIQITNFKLFSRKSFYMAHVWKHLCIYIDIEVTKHLHVEDGIGEIFIEFQYLDYELHEDRYCFMFWSLKCSKPVRRTEWALNIFIILGILLLNEWMDNL